MTTFATAALVAGVLGHPPTATASGPVFDDIPTRFIEPEDPEQYPDPIPLELTGTAKREQTSGPDPEGRLEIAYWDEDVPSFEGSVRLHVLLYGEQQWQDTTVEDVYLTEGVEREYIAPAGSGWTWDEVEYVRAELVPDA